jgi:hypothetical protein
MLTGEDRARVLDRRRSDAREMAREANRARRRARTRLAPITGPGEPVDVTVVTASEPQAGVTSLAKTRRAHLRLLGIEGVEEAPEHAPAG